MSNADTLKIVLLGKTGMGKSSLGNSLANCKPGEKFKVGSGLMSETRYCDWKKGTHPNGQTVEVVDTPGLCDTHIPEKEIYKEVGKTVALADEGPHVLVIALRCDRRFTDEEYGAYQTIIKLFTTEINNHLIIVFNGLDGLIDDDDDEENEMTKIQSARAVLAGEIVKFGDNLKTLIQKAKGGYFAMNNKALKPARDTQVQELLDKMLKLKASNGNKRFTTDTTKQIAAAVRELEGDYKQRGLSQAEAAVQVKKDIVENKNPGFLQKVGGIIGSAVRTVGAALSDACSVM